MVNAVVLVQCEIDEIPEAAQAIADIPGVSEVYSVAGEYDLVVIIRVGDHDDPRALPLRGDERIGEPQPFELEELPRAHRDRGARGGAGEDAPDGHLGRLEPQAELPRSAADEPRGGGRGKEEQERRGQETARPPGDEGSRARRRRARAEEQLVGMHRLDRHLPGDPLEEPRPFLHGGERRATPVAARSSCVRNG